MEDGSNGAKRRRGATQDAEQTPGLRLLLVMESHLLLGNHRVQPLCLTGVVGVNAVLIFYSFLPFETREEAEQPCLTSGG